MTRSAKFEAVDPPPMQAVQQRIAQLKDTIKKDAAGPYFPKAPDEPAGAPETPKQPKGPGA
jgi:hypothetical protein